MKKNNLKVFVITRFGIGQSSNNFYDRELPYLENLLAKSIIKQKKFITKWIILIDVHTPKNVIKKISKLIPKDILCIHLHDIFLSADSKGSTNIIDNGYGDLMPDIPMILRNLGVKDYEKVVTIRIDADDMLSNDYITNVLNEIDRDDLKDKYELISVNANYGVYFYPLKKKMIKIYKKNYSVQALYSIFGKNFYSVYDFGHQQLEEMVIKKGGYGCQLRKKEFWLRSMRQYSVSQLGNKFGVLFGRFDLIKNIIKILFNRFLNHNTFFKGHIKKSDLSTRFDFAHKLIYFFYLHEKNLERKKTVFSPTIKAILKLNKNKNKTKIQKILLDMYVKETDQQKKKKIKNEFYNF